MNPDIFGLPGSTTIEKVKLPRPGVLVTRNKRTVEDRRKTKTLTHIIPVLPAPSEQIHLVSDGSFDYFMLIPHILGLIQTPAEFYGSTWTMNRANAMELFKLYDMGKINTLNVLTGVYFKRRETSVYAQLITGIQERGGRYVAFENHAKVFLLHSGPDYVVAEGSANWTGNPRLEQHVITNDPLLYRFHRGWMDEMFK